MTDIERLRELLAEWRENAKQAEDDGWLTAANACRDCAEQLEAALLPLLADYERLRGMEERVKGAVVAELGGQFLEAWDCYALVPELADGGFLTSDHPLNGQTVALVPVPGGE